MSPEERELLRLALLRVLDTNRTAFGLPAPALGLQIRRFGFQVDPAELTVELEYLLDKGLVALKDKVISPENRAWRLTAAGRDFIALH